MVDVQRGGPSTGLPTKTEQADLLQAMFGRNGEAPVPIVAPRSPGDCFDAAMEAARIAVTYRTPVMLLSDGYLANGSEPWQVPDAGVAAHDRPGFRHRRPTTRPSRGQHEFWPYQRDPETLARPWAVPGTPGLEHRIGGLEKADGHGNISYDPTNHDLMVRTRQAKVDRIADTIGHVEVDDPGRLGPAPRPRLGIDVRADRRRLPPDPGSRTADRPGASSPPEPVPAQPRRRAAPLRPGGGTRDEPRPAGAAAAGQVPRRRHRLQPGARPAVRRRRARGRVQCRARGGAGSDDGPADAGARRPGSCAASRCPTYRLTRKEFSSDQEVRWCPGCGDYIILAAVQGFLPSLGLAPGEHRVRLGDRLLVAVPVLPRHLRLHSIHGRAPAIATGLATTRPDLSVWVVTGDGDALSIGGNHLIHAMRRNVNLTILLFNNRIYGLTKGQYSPTSEVGKITKSTPMGSLDHPFNPISLALGAEATFVARTLDSDRAHLTMVLKAAAAHRGTSLVEIYQNCPIYNDGAFDVLKDAAEAAARLVRLEHGQPVRVGEHEWVHDAHADDPSRAFEISRLDDRTMTHVPIGIFRQVERPTYDDQVRAQVDEAREPSGRGRPRGAAGRFRPVDRVGVAPTCRPGGYEVSWVV